MIQWRFLSILKMVSFDSSYGIEQSWIVVACHLHRREVGYMEGLVDFSLLGSEVRV